MTAERNRALRIAYGHARAGRFDLAERWHDLAASFHPVSDRQERHLTRVALEAGNVHPDQLAIPQIIGRS